MHAVRGEGRIAQCLYYFLCSLFNISNTTNNCITRQFISVSPELAPDRARAVEFGRHRAGAADFGGKRVGPDLKVVSLMI